MRDDPISKRETKSVGDVLRNRGAHAAGALIVRLCLERHRAIHPRDGRPDAEILAGADVLVSQEGGVLSVSVAYDAPP